MFIRVILLPALFFSLCLPAFAEELTLYGAGSLRAAIDAIVADYSKRTGVAVRTAYGPSGVMRDKIEAGDRVDIFASADMGHALKLKADGRAAEVAMFNRNQLCAFAKPEAQLTSVSFAERLLSTDIRLGTSTPKADPGGDYTWEMFHLIDKAHGGAFAALDQKARKVVGGAVEASGANPVKAAFERGEINVMIAYCSGFAQMRRDVPDVERVEIPKEFAVGAEYGLAIMKLDNPAATGLAFAILSPEGQATLARYGFAPVGVVAKP